MSTIGFNTHRNRMIIWIYRSTSTNQNSISFQVGDTVAKLGETLCISIIYFPLLGTVPIAGHGVGRVELIEKQLKRRYFSWLL